MKAIVYVVSYSANDYKSNYINTCCMPPVIRTNFIEAVEAIGSICDMNNARQNERYYHVSKDGKLHAFRADYEGGYFEFEIWENTIEL